jgi:pyrimidine-specific ribonucleoside hydrolase
MTHQLILDVDTGIDDALALCFAVAHPDIDILAISCVAGNTDVGQVVDNTLRLLDALEAGPIPVARGAERPLLSEPLHAKHVHGADGMGDLRLPRPVRKASPLSAIDETRRALCSAEGAVTYVCLGPATNLALLLRTDPILADRINQVVFMGGAAAGGNATAVAEFNVWQDPEAAHIVTTSGLPTRMFTLEAFTGTVAEPRRISAFLDSGSPIERLVASLISYRAESGKGSPFGLLGDAAVVCGIVAPGTARSQVLPVGVDKSSGPSRGQTLVDRREKPGEDALHGIRNPWPRIDAVEAVYPDRLNEVYFSVVSAYAASMEMTTSRATT